ncbi:MAG: hypothetical protein RL618_2526, partial [Pseudomonadota bacterium]
PRADPRTYSISAKIQNKFFTDRIAATESAAETGVPSIVQGVQAAFARHQALARTHTAGVIEETPHPSRRLPGAAGASQLADGVAQR